METLKSSLDWQEVPEEHWEQWNLIFRNTRESLNLKEPCPVCKHHTLHQWFDREPGSPQMGAVWEWCSHCGTFSHGSIRTPIWWSPPSDFHPDLSQIKVIPLPIEDARVEWEREGS
jgi:hypothetical protein